jgi:hypothetical protein
VRLARLDFEGEFVLADADAVTVGQGCSAANSLLSHSRAYAELALTAVRRSMVKRPMSQSMSATSSR